MIKTLCAWEDIPRVGAFLCHIANVLFHQTDVKTLKLTVVCLVLFLQVPLLTPQDEGFSGEAVTPGCYRAGVRAAWAGRPLLLCHLSLHLSIHLATVNLV